MKRNSIASLSFKREIPSQKTAFGAKYQPRNADPSTHEGRVKVFLEEFAKLESGDHSNIWSASMALASAGDARAIPVLIGAIEADNS